MLGTPSGSFSGTRERGFHSENHVSSHPSRELQIDLGAILQSHVPGLQEVVRLLRGKKGKSMKAEQVELEETFSGGGSLAWVPSLSLCVSGTWKLLRQLQACNMTAWYDVDTTVLSLIAADSLGQTLAASSQGHYPCPHISCENSSMNLVSTLKTPGSSAVHPMVQRTGSYAVHPAVRQHS